MITIIEGPDCAGKTTLAREICELTGAVYLHQGPYQQDVLIETLDLLHEHLVAGRDVVCDRLHVGEKIYGPIVRDHCMMTRAQERMIERVLLAHETLVVIALPPKRVVLENWRTLREQRDEYLQAESLVSDVYDAYEKLYCEVNTVLSCVHWDYTIDRSIPALLAARPRSPKNCGPGIGVFREGVTLLVGERFSAAQLGVGWRYPFVGSTSSVWLTECLEEWHVFESRLYWVNAIEDEEDGPDGYKIVDLDPSFIDELRPTDVITLGNWAQDWAIRHAIEHRAVPHPQYWKRFHHCDEYALQRALFRGDL